MRWELEREVGSWDSVPRASSVALRPGAHLHLGGCGGAPQLGIRGSENLSRMNRINHLGPECKSEHLPLFLSLIGSCNSAAGASDSKYTVQGQLSTHVSPERFCPRARVACKQHL